MVRDLLTLMVSRTSPAAVELSTVIGVGGCGHFISSNAMCWMTPSFILVKSVAASASEACRGVQNWAIGWISCVVPVAQVKVPTA